MATFNGEDLGFIFAMNTAPATKSRQINTYPGANGLEVIDLGTRGGQTVLDGALFAANAASLAALEQSFRTLQEDGGPYNLVDTLGTAWSNVILVAFAPQGRVFSVVGGALARKYHAEFLHTS